MVVVTRDFLLSNNAANLILRQAPVWDAYGWVRVNIWRYESCKMSRNLYGFPFLCTFYWNILFPLLSNSYIQTSACRNWKGCHRSLLFYCTIRHSQLLIGRHHARSRQSSIWHQLLHTLRQPMTGLKCMRCFLFQREIKDIVKVRI